MSGDTVSNMVIFKMGFVHSHHSHICFCVSLFSACPLSVQVYPTLSISHIEESKRPITIRAWCKKSWGHCQTHPYIVLPYRCLGKNKLLTFPEMFQVKKENKGYILHHKAKNMYIFTRWKEREQRSFWHISYFSRNFSVPKSWVVWIGPPTTTHLTFTKHCRNLRKNNDAASAQRNW